MFNKDSLVCIRQCPGFRQLLPSQAGRATGGVASVYSFIKVNHYSDLNFIHQPEIGSCQCFNSLCLDLLREGGISIAICTVFLQYRFVPMIQFCTAIEGMTPETDGLFVIYLVTGILCGTHPSHQRKKPVHSIHVKVTIDDMAHTATNSAQMFPIAAFVSDRFVPPTKGC